MNKRKKTGMYLGKVMCKFAETFAPQASELCRGQYYLNCPLCQGHFELV